MSRYIKQTRGYCLLPCRQCSPVSQNILQFSVRHYPSLSSQLTSFALARIPNISPCFLKCFFLIFLCINLHCLHCMTCGILGSQSGTEPVLLKWKGEIPTTSTPGKSLQFLIYYNLIFSPPKHAISSNILLHTY